MKQADESADPPTLADALAMECECMAKLASPVRYMMKLAASGEHSDLRFVLCGKVSYPLHRAMVAQSPLIAGLLGDAWHAPTGGSSLHIHYAVPDDDENDADVIFERSVFAWETAVVAMYGGCATLLGARITIRTFLDTLNAGMHFDLPHLVDVCCEYYLGLLSAQEESDDFAELAANLLMRFPEGPPSPEFMDLTAKTIQHLRSLGPSEFTREVLFQCTPELIRRVVLSPSFFISSEIDYFNLLCDLSVAPASIIAAVRFSSMAVEDVQAALGSLLAKSNPAFRMAIEASAFGATVLRSAVLAAEPGDTRLFDAASASAHDGRESEIELDVDSDDEGTVHDEGACPTQALIAAATAPRRHRLRLSISHLLDPKSEDVAMDLAMPRFFGGRL
ncbi:hypothetical protein H9P43_006708 [Blastocladiella emersonii ATCC 22665]|nr:hypothetical protein H9P43_006708 [Blastocladiella emersonii ATCC 22665]